MIVLDDNVFIVISCRSSAGSPVAADAAPTCIIYPEDSTTPIYTHVLTQHPTKLDQYTHLVQASTLNNFLSGKQYVVRVEGSTGSVPWVALGYFKVEWPALDLNTTGASNFKSDFENGRIATVQTQTANLPTAAVVATAVVDQALAGHTNPGSVGGALNAASSAGDPWATTSLASYGAGTAGKLVSDNLDAKVSTRATPADVPAASIASILAKTNNLPAAPAAVADIPTAVAIAGQVATAATATPLPVNVKKVNDVVVIGNGTDTNLWRATGT